LRDDDRKGGGESDAEVEAWVEAFRNGEQRELVFSKLVAHFSAMTMAFFSRRIRSRSVAEDLNQELYLNVYRHLGDFRGECSFQSWLFTLAFNQLTGLRRRWKAHPDQNPSIPRAELWEDMEIDAGAGPDAAAAEQEHRLALVRCLAELDEERRSVIIGQYYRGVTLAELTTRMNLENKSGARSLLVGGLRRLKKCLAAHGITSAE